MLGHALPLHSGVDLLGEAHLIENPKYLQDQIITYIGNKRSLLPFIGKGVDYVKKQTSKNKLTTLDLFSGSGIVARYFKQHSSHIIANDLENYSKINNECYLSNRLQIDQTELSQWILKLHHQTIESLHSGFLTELYAPKDEAHILPEERVFYTRKNAMYLDTARQLIDTAPEHLQKYLLAPLIAKASIHPNTSGVFKGFYKNSAGIGQYGGNGRDALTRIYGQIELTMPVLSNFDSSYTVHQCDANVLVHGLESVDLAYFDPPYNQHPYGSNYFMLNLVANYEKPVNISRVSGIPKDWNRSKYNVRSEAETALFDLIKHCKARYILISYNSEGFVRYEQFKSVLEKMGHLEIMETAYNTFRGSRNLRERDIHVKEYLFLLRKH